MNKRMKVVERIKSFMSRMIVYEEDGVLKVFDAPANVPYEEFLAKFEAEKGVKCDPITGICMPVAKDAPAMQTPAATPTNAETSAVEAPKAEGSQNDDATNGDA